MEQEQPMTLTYEKCLELGFKRHNGHDPVFLRQNGYEYFILELEIGNKAFEWDTHTHQVYYFVDANTVKRGITLSEFEELSKVNEVFEVFCDPCYYDMYAVRHIGNTDFDSVLHFTEKKDAEKFKELLLKAK